MWGSFDWLLDTLGTDCVNTCAAAKSLSYEKDLRDKVKELVKAFQKVDEIETDLGIEEWKK